MSEKIRLSIFFAFLLMIMEYTSGFFVSGNSSPRGTRSGRLYASKRFPSLWANSMFSSVDRMFDDIFSDVQESFLSIPSYSVFPLDIRETSDSYELFCDIPGVKKEDIKLEVDNGVLTITSERKREAKEESDRILKAERFEGKMTRAIKLPENSDENYISAKFEDGVLMLKLKKTDPEVAKIKQILIE